MSSRMTRFVCALAAIFALVLADDARAQFFPATGACYCLRPVTQTLYRTVPVTSYRQVTQTVRRPVIETTYVDQPVTEWRQVTETKTVNVPTVSYQTVTSYRTVQYPAGQWVTKYYYTPRISPCQYDNRPDIFGFINRTAYSIRQAFTPSIIASREYVGGTMAQSIPMTRTVAVPGTRTVSYNVNRMVAYTSTRKVAVNSIRYVDEQVVSLQPVTVMRNIPVGTRTVYSYSPYISGGTQTVLLPSPVISSPPRSATKTRRFDAGEADEIDNTRSAVGGGNRTSARSTLPTVIRVSGWRARRPTAATVLPQPAAVVQIASDR